MKLHSLMAAVALVGAIGSASAQQEAMLINADADGCQLYAPYAWIELAPGQKWSATVDLSQCSASELGWFRYYGHVGTNSSCNTLKVKDGVVLRAMRFDTQELFSPAVTATGKDEEYVLLNLDRPTQFRLTAENTSRQRIKVRMTWVSMTK